MANAPRDRRVLLSWSSGKDSAWTLHVLRQQGVDVVGLLTSFNEAVGRVSMHAVRQALVEAQASAAGLPLWPLYLPWPCSNDQYEQRMRVVIERAREDGITHVAFGDLFLEDIRDYRIRQLSGTGIEPMFPLWCSAEDTPGLARRLLDAGVRAVLTCVDPRQLPESFVGRAYDEAFLADLPPGVDPCGERGRVPHLLHRGADVRLGDRRCRSASESPGTASASPISGPPAPDRHRARDRSRVGERFLTRGGSLVTVLPMRLRPILATLLLALADTRHAGAELGAPPARARGRGRPRIRGERGRPRRARPRMGAHRRARRPGAFHGGRSPSSAAAVALAWRRPRRAAALALVLVLAVFAFEDGLHSVHHGLDQTQASSCPVARPAAT